MKYYFFASALPPLQIGHPPDIGFHAFRFLLRSNLTREDFEKAKLMRLYYDIQNIRAFWLKEELDPRGFFNPNELEDALLTGTGFPVYVYDFLKKYDTPEDRLHFFSALVATYFRLESENSEGYLQEYLTFEREWRLVLTGFRAKLLERDLAKEIQFEDPNDQLVRQIMAQKDAKSYEPPSRFADLKALFEQHRDNPLELHQSLCEYRFQKLEEMYGIDVFSIGRILTYMAQLIIVEKWLELDKKKGLQIVGTIVKEAS